jgi:hypothetical protein
MVGIGKLRDRCIDVEIYDESFRRGRQFVQLMCAFSQCDKITFSNVPYFAIEDIPKNCFSFPMSKGWHLYHGVEPNFVYWMSLQDTASSITSLSLPSCGPAGGTLLRAIGESLMEIELQIRKPEKYGYQPRRRDHDSLYSSCHYSLNKVR